MYKTSYERDFHWPERALKSGNDPCAFGTREGTRTTNYDPKQTECVSVCRRKRGPFALTGLLLVTGTIADLPRYRS